jgi:hypothetical protein
MATDSKIKESDKISLGKWLVATIAMAIFLNGAGMDFGFALLYGLFITVSLGNARSVGLLIICMFSIESILILAPLLQTHLKGSDWGKVEHLIQFIQDADLSKSTLCLFSIILLPLFLLSLITAIIKRNRSSGTPESFMQTWLPRN